MLTKEERRFLRSWEDQRKGGKLSYFLLYIIAGSIVMTIGVGFVWSMVQFSLPKPLWAIPLTSFVLSSLYAGLTWRRGEAKFKRLIKREVSSYAEAPADDGSGE